MIDLLVSLKGGGLEGVIFTGGGEPFYNSHTVDGIELARDLGMGVGVFTNGSLLDQDAISRISNCADFIRLSINAVSEGRYLNFHGIHDASLLESVKKNVLRLAQARTHNGHASFGLGVIVDENNVDDLVPVASFASEVVKTTGGGIDYVGFRPVVDYWHGGNVISSRLVHKIRDYEVEVRRILSQAGIVPFFAFDYFSDASSCAERPKEYSKCLANPWAVSCAYDGTLYLCSENDGNPDYALGNLLRSSFDEIWSGDRRKEVIERIGDCPAPVCKLHRLNKSLVRMGMQPMDDKQSRAVRGFLDILTYIGDPGGVRFL